MKSKAMQIIGFFGILIVAFIVMKGIEASAKDVAEKKPTDNRPIVNVETLIAIDHQVTISSFGAVTPLETTVLAAQVSGEVLQWNQNFVAGGIVKRNEILFSIEPDTYEAAVLQAEAQVSLAQATLIEELARQRVAEQEAKNLSQSQVSDLYLRKPQVLSAEAQLKSAQASLRIAQRNLNKTMVRAPYDALVVSRDIGTGQYVTPGMRVAELNNIETAEILVPIAGFDSQFLMDDIENISTSITTEGRINKNRIGYVSRNLGRVDEATRMQYLVVRLDDPYGLTNGQASIKFGTYVEVSFDGKQLENVFKVAQSLVNNGKIWVVNGDDKLESHKVNVIREEGSFFFINAGISESDRVAKSLPEYPQNGMDVKVINVPSAIVSIESAHRSANASLLQADNVQ